MTVLMSLCVSMFAYVFEDNGIFYEITSEDKKTLKVTRKSQYSTNDYKGDVVIPEYVSHNGDYYTVTSIDKGAFHYCSDLLTVQIPNSVTYIGKGAFISCSGLTSVNIPNNVTSIDENVFTCCSSLKSITIPSSVTSIGNGAFSYCSSFTSVNIPNSVTKLGNWVFEGCSSITSVTIPNSVTSIGAGAFYLCSSLTSIIIPNDVTSIGSGAFNECDSLKTVTLLCSDVGSWFRGMKSIKEVIIGNSVTSIGDYAFEGCSGLTSVTIGNSVKSIGNYAFSYCSGLTSVTIPNSVKSIGNYAFSYCSGLTSVTIPNSVTSIDYSAFEGCSGLTSVTIGNSVTSIGYSAFYGCSGLNSVTIGNSVTSIGSRAFNECDSLKTVTLLCSDVGSWFRGMKSIKEVIIGNSVTSIGDYAFEGCSGLTSVTIGNSVKSIGNYAFSYCSGLTSVTIPNSVKSIGNYAFSYCSGLTSVTIPNSVTSIDYGAFRGCSGLTSVTIPNSVTSIGDYAFEGCSGLTSVTIPNSVTSFGQKAFYLCTSLSSVSIGSGVTSIVGSFYGCPIDTVCYYAKEFYSSHFSGSNSLKEVILGENVEVVHIGKNIIKFLRCLAKIPPKLVYDEYDCYVHNLEVPYGCSFIYAKDENWEKIPIIYSVYNDTKYYPIKIYNIGNYVVSINGNTDGYEAREGEFVEVNSFGTLTNHPLIMKGTQNISHILLNQGGFAFVTSENHSDNIIFTYDFPLIEVTLSESGTLIDKINMDEIQTIENLKISGDINGTDILVIRKMENLKLLDLKDAHIVNGGMSYYQNYVTSQNKIGDNFFCNPLLTIILPQDITEIGKYAFEIAKLVTISIPKSLKKLSDFNFAHSNDLTSVYIEDLAAYCTINFGDVWYNKRDIYLNDKKIVDLIIPDGLTKISDRAFYRLNGLNTVIIPASVTKIGKNAFDCHIDKSITCLNPTPPEIVYSTFYYMDYETTILYVPKGSKTLYWLHPYWENFKNIVELDDSGVNDITVDPSPKSKGVYTIDGVKLSANADNIENLPKGIYIINGEKVVIK